MKQIFKILVLLWFVPSVVSAAINDPTDIPNLIHWIDAKDINGDGTVPADGSTVNNWVDKSASGIDLGPGTQAEPIYDANGWPANNSPAVRFGSGNAPSNLAGGDPFGGTQSESTIFLVHREAVRRNALTVQFNGSTSGQNPYFLTWSNGRFYHRIQNTWVQDLHGVAAGDPIIVTSYHSQTGNPTRYININGNQIATSTAVNSNSTAGGLHLGWGWSASAYYFDGWISEMIIYDRALTPTEIADVEDYLDQKWIQVSNDVDLVITKQAYSDSACTTLITSNVDEGATVYYCINAQNNGPANATNIVIEENLPAGLTIQSGTPSQGTYTP